ncbi:MAG: acetoacetate decarboxylase family protein [Actinobacteria bacterium]|nr:acetoacetate decarboxylase family protein [Actinomycetota bacterium]
MEGLFLEEVEQKEVAISGGSCAVPVLYREVFAVAGIFLAPTLKLRDLLPTSKLVPVEVMPGKGLLAVMAFDYRDTSIGPYREMGIAVPARYRPRLNPMLIPPLRMAASLTFEAFVWQLPVTTDIALRAGVDIWGYPKFLGEIEFEEGDKAVTCTLKEKGEHILTLEVRKSPPRMKTYFDLNTYTVKDRELLLTPIRGISTSLGRSFIPGTARIALGEHGISRKIREIAPGKSIHSLYIPRARMLLPEAERRLAL